MITITSMKGLIYSMYDEEVWAIVRSLKYANANIKHVPELSPSWSLFKKYLSLREAGEWNEETFRNVYVPQFLKEMHGKEQQDLLKYLFSTKKHICLVCFCPEEELCHRSIIGGMLQGAGLDVRGLSNDYSHYFNWYKNGVPGVSEETVETKNIADYNSNVTYLYSTPQISSLTDRSKTMCFTGRRPKDLCWYDLLKYGTFVNDLMKLIYEDFYVKQNIRQFITGGAQGFDQMAFWAVDKMKKTYQCDDVQNIVFVPFEGQETRWAEKGLFSQTEYWMMIKNADEVVIVCDNNSLESLFERNHTMCDYSETCLALYPDEFIWQWAKGGTAECIRYAKEHCQTVYRLDYQIDGLGLHMGKTTTV